MAENLSPGLESAILKAFDIKRASFRTRISEIRRANPALTHNAAAHIFSQKKGKSQMRYLDAEDRKSLPVPPHLPVIQYRPAVKHGRKTRTHVNRPGKDFVVFQTDDKFQKRHIQEVNSTYEHGNYIATYILCRKIIENLIIDLLVKRFPNNDLPSRSLYYDVARGRFNDFSVTLKNLHDKRSEYPDKVKKAVERLCQLAKGFAKDANNQTHSWFYIATKKELDESSVQEILDLIETINSSF